jgi:hypothetical protein
MSVGWDYSPGGMAALVCRRGNVYFRMIVDWEVWHTTTHYPDWYFRGITQSLQATTGIVP